MKRIAIIGGGIAGLAAAYALEKRRRSGARLEYVLYESSPRLGGVISTERAGECLFEGGPDSFVSEKTWAADLCRELGLGEQLIASNDGERKTYIALSGKLIPMPDGLTFLVPTKILPVFSSPLFSMSTKLRIAREWYRPPSAATEDESVASFIARHYGDEMVERLADPLLSGIFGGESSQLSARAVLPRLVEMEAKYGSLGRGMLATKIKTKKMPSGPAPRSIFTSLRDGMQSLVDVLESAINPASIRLSTPAQALNPLASGWTVSAGYSTDQFNSVIVATPTQVAADLLQHVSHDLDRELRGIPYTSSITVNLEFGNEVRAALPPGFGFLVPRSEGKSLMAATFVHNKFPFRAPKDVALLRCFIGGATAEKFLSAPDAAIVAAVLSDLAQLVGIKAPPGKTQITRWPRALAQYTVGHLERLMRIDAVVTQLPGLTLAGNGYRGIGIPDCIRSGTQAAERLAG